MFSFFFSLSHCVVTEYRWIEDLFIDVKWTPNLILFKELDGPFSNFNLKYFLTWKCCMFNNGLKN